MRLIESRMKFIPVLCEASELNIAEFDNAIVYLGNDVDCDTDTQLTDRWMWAVEELAAQGGSDVIGVKYDYDSYDAAKADLLDFLKGAMPLGR